jgi:hypothetical protein
LARSSGDVDGFGGRFGVGVGLLLLVQTCTCGVVVELLLLLLLLFEKVLFKRYGTTTTWISSSS